jgi:lipopolysaccharide export LptBFGC system permease protein LptF
MKILSILCYILAGAFFFSAANLSGRAVSNGYEDPAYLVGVYLPAAICIGLGILFGRMHKRKKTK